MPGMDMSVDFLSCIASQLDVTSKYNFASVTKEVWILLSHLFEEWDYEMANHISSTIEKNYPFGSFKMDEYKAEGFDYSRISSDVWVTTERDYPPRFTFEYKGGGCMAFAHVRMTGVKAEYKVKPYQSEWLQENFPNRGLFTAHPRIRNAVYNTVASLFNGLKVKYIDWKCHPDKEVPGVAYFLGNPVLEDGRAVFVRSHNVVSSEVAFSNPRLNVEMMGVALLDKSNYEGEGVVEGRACHANMKQLRVYVKKCRVLF